MTASPSATPLPTPLPLDIICCCTLIVSPVVLCLCFPAIEYISRLQKELLASSLGTICAFAFFEIMPAILADAAHHDLHKHRDKRLILSCTVLLGMLFAFFLGMLHEFMEHKHCEESNNKHQSSRCLSWIPSTCKVIWIGTALHNLADGMIIGFKPTAATAYPLFIHEITHTLCNVTFYMTLGMSKCNAVILRIGSCIFVFVGAFGAQTQLFKHLHTQGHAFVLGIFLYMMLVDVLPIVTGDQEHNHCIETSANDENQDEPNDKTTTIQVDEENETTHHHHHHHHHKHSTRRTKALLFLVFLLSFAVVALSIMLSDDPHEQYHKAGGCAHDHGAGGCEGHGHGHGHGHRHGHGHGHGRPGDGAC